jgi:hypothetical protein
MARVVPKRAFEDESQLLVVYAQEQVEALVRTGAGDADIRAAERVLEAQTKQASISSAKR